MGIRLKPERVNIEEYRAKICCDMVLEFKNQIKFESRVDEQEYDKRKLSDYDLQQFWRYIQKKITSL